MDGDRLSLTSVARNVFIPIYILLVPWMWSPFPFNVQWADLFFLFILIAFIVTKSFRRVRFIPMDALVLAYVGGSAFSLLNAPVIGSLDIAKLVSLVLLYFVFGSLFEHEKTRMQIVFWLVAGTFVVCGIGISFLVASMIWELPIDLLGMEMMVPGFGEVVRLKAGFPTPELLGNYFTISFPFLIGFLILRWHQRWKQWGVIGIVGVVAAETLTYSHSWGGFLAAAIVFCWDKWEKFPLIWVRRVLVLGVVALLLVINLASIAYIREVSLKLGTIPVSSLGIPDHVIRGREWPQLQITATYQYIQYVSLKAFAWSTFLEHPIVGVGAGAFPEATKKAHHEGRIPENILNSDPHSAYFGQLAETGFLGSVTFVVLWAGVLLLAKRFLNSAEGQQSKFVARASLAGLVGLLINGINVDIMHFRFLWVGLAFLRGCLSAEHRKWEGYEIEAR